jgi:hypothetical protein
VGDRIAYHAQARDAGAAVVHGIKFSYQSLTPGTVSIDEAGRATMLAPGLATIACTAGAATGTALVLVRPGSRPVQTDAQWRLDQGSATATTGTGGSAALAVPGSEFSLQAADAVATTLGSDRAPRVGPGRNRREWPRTSVLGRDRRRNPRPGGTPDVAHQHHHRQGAIVR